jgi:osmotically inducible lipoprotein OsmB
MKKNQAHTTLATIIAYTFAACTSFTLTSCGESLSDRSLSGAGIGAAAGTVGTVIGGGNPVTGAVIGGAVGAAAGALTDKDQINLGKPVWRKHR